MRLLRALQSGITLLASLTVVSFLSPLPGFSQQVSTDNTVGTTVDIDSSNKKFTIEEGSLVNNSLFHSFNNFSPKDWTVVFNLDSSRYSNVDVIIGRVTGQQSSYINGDLQILGGNSPDLLLINPSGINFGSSANLELPGSFLASTAQSVIFNDYAFDTQNPQAVPLLLVSTPIGLQMGMRSQAITYQGIGHSLLAMDPILTPFQSTALPSGLVVESDETVSLVGNGIKLNGGTITAPNGKIELLSISQGSPTFTPSSFAVSDIEPINEVEFNAIVLDNSALLDVSGTAAGEIAIVGKDIGLHNNSNIWSQNIGAMPSGDINITATGHLNLTSSRAPNMNILSGVKSDAIGTGSAANINIESATLSLLAGSSIASRTFGQGKSGDVSIRTQNLAVMAYSQHDSSIFSRIGSNTIGPGQGGDVLIETNTLSLEDGGYIGSTTILSTGSGGDIDVKADDISLSGATPTGELTLLTALSIGGSGDSGNLKINTRRLSLSDSGSISTSSFGAGSSGDIYITATEQIEISGRKGDLLESSIRSSVLPTPLNYQLLIGTTQTPTGDAGRVDIETDRLSLKQSGILSVANSGVGESGTLNVRAREIDIDSGKVSAVTQSGQGGDISITAETLIASQNSLIQATSLGNGNGGNISIETDFAIGRQNSDIVANAVEGRGGNINIRARRLFGFEPSSHLTAGSDITASSELGVDGTIAISNDSVGINPEVAGLPVYFSDADDRVAAECASGSGSRFVASGKGGLATGPSSRIAMPRLWADIRPSRQQAAQRSANAALPTDLPTDPADFSEAVGWNRSANGTVELVATSTRSTPIQLAAQCLQRYQRPF